LIAYRIASGLSRGELPPSSEEVIGAGISHDFSKERSALEQWSALYHVYVAPGIDSPEVEISTLVDYALGHHQPGVHLAPKLQQKVHRSNARQFRRRVVGGLKLLRKAVCQWESEAQKGRRRIQLPGVEYVDYYDPTDAVQQVVRLLASTSRVRLLSIQGLGGIGKTALARRVADQVSAQPDVTRITWISARPMQFFTRSDEPLAQDEYAARSRADVIDALVSKLGYEHLRRYSTDEQVERLIPILASQSALVVIDNLETIDDIRLLMPDLNRLQGATRFLLTSRESLAVFAGVHAYPLSDLPFTDSRGLLNNELGHLGSNRQLSEVEAQKVYGTVGGNPLALKLIAAQLATLPDVDMALADLRRAVPGEKPEVMFDFIYRCTWRLLSVPARRLLLAIYDGVSPEGSDLNWIQAMVEPQGLEGMALKTALAELYRYALIEVIPAVTPVYALHRLTITFLQTNVAQTRWRSGSDISLAAGV